MIHDISSPAQNPLRIAQVLAELWNGKVVPLLSHPASSVVLASDEQGPMIKIHPLGTELVQ